MMRQAWVIFQKDTYGLRAEIALLAALAAALAWAETRLTEPVWVETIAVLAVNYLVARVIHNEAIPGTNQFWRTRPYRWKSLLAAKLLFILICIQLPLLLAQIYMIAAGGFLFSESLPGLLWSQLLLLFCGVLPVACLATLTTGLVSFFLSELLVAAGLVGLELLRARKLWMLPAMQPGPEAMDWVRNSAAALVVASFASLVLFRQYRSRATIANRAWGAAGIVSAGAVFLLTPWSIAFGVQTGLSKQAVEGSGLNVPLKASLKTIAESVFPIRGNDETGRSEVNLPIAIRGLSAGIDSIAADALFVTLTAADGQSWSSDLVPVLARPGEPGIALVNADLAVDDGFFRKESQRPVSLYARIYLTLFGNVRSQEIPIQQTPANVTGRLQCSEGVFLQFSCRSIFRWPRLRVSAATVEGSDGSVVNSLSYSPFPAELGFGSMERHSFSLPYAASKVTIRTAEPVSHLKAALRIPGVVLARFTKEAKHKWNNGVTGTE